MVGQEYFSIVYEDNFGKLKSFFPDYIVCDKNDEIWILETKGGESKSGNTEDIDKYSPKKFAALKAYLQKHNLKGGFVREKKDENELCICTEQYSDDLSDDNWLLLEDVLA